jgi:hypothetical protein
VVEFVDMTPEELVTVTFFLHSIMPPTRDMFVYGIEKAQPTDLSVVFHLVHRDKQQRDKKQTVILSAQYIIDHPFWKKDIEE